jgi:hypothetical protein
VTERDLLQELFDDFENRAQRSEGTPSCWYWREAASAVNAKIQLRHTLDGRAP